MPRQRESQPDSIKALDQTIPHCCRCGCDVPSAKVLWTLCEPCKEAKRKASEEAAQRNRGQPIDPKWRGVQKELAPFVEVPLTPKNQEARKKLGLTDEVPF